DLTVTGVQTCALPISPQATATPFRSPRTVTSSITTSPPSQQEETRPGTVVTPRPSATPRSPSANSAAQFPVAKPVPGKPGYVFRSEERRVGKEVWFR